MFQMPEPASKRVRRTPEQRAAEIDSKIAKANEAVTALLEKKDASVAAFDEKIAALQARIAEYQKQKEAILAPKPPRKPRKTKKQRITEIVTAAQKSGMDLKEIAEKLGVDLSE